MSSIRARLQRLERQHPAPRQRTFAQFMADHAALYAWLEERGYPDHLAALEAGESGPEGLEKLLREQAAYDPKRRAWARIEAALDAGQLPHDVDLRLVSLLPSGLLPIPLARPAAGYTVPGRRKNLSPSQEIPRSA
jgi:hypothetical protein